MNKEEKNEGVGSVKKHNQIIHFITGYKRTITGIIRIWENEMTHLLTEDGVEWIINKSNVACVEKFLSKND